MSQPIERVPLTEEQRRFAEDNHGLIWWYINSHPMPQSAEIVDDDWYSLIAEALVIAVTDWWRFPELRKKYAFATVFVTIADSRVKRQICRDKTVKRKGITVSYDAPLENAEDAATFQTYISDGGAEFAESVETSVTVKDILSNAGLSDRERGVITMCFGFDGHRRTLEEVGGFYGVGRERARQIREQAISKMRYYTETGTALTPKEIQKKHMIEDYLGGMTRREVAIKYGFTEDQLRRKLERWRVKKRKTCRKPGQENKQGGKMNKQIKVVRIDPCKPPELVAVPDTLQGLQEAIGGHIEIVPCGAEHFKHCVLVIDEEGKIKGLESNPYASKLFGSAIDCIVGPALLCGTDVFGDITDLPRGMLRRWSLNEDV